MTLTVGTKVRFKKAYNVYQRGDTAYVSKVEDNRGYVTVTPYPGRGTSTGVPASYLKKA